jgi:hypothetical protein
MKLKTIKAYKPEDLDKLYNDFQKTRNIIVRASQPQDLWTGEGVIYIMHIYYDEFAELNKNGIQPNRGAIDGHIGKN